MKFCLLALLVVAFGGCAPQNIANNATPTESCSIVAERLMQDGAMKGYNLGLQKAVYRDAYADCVKSNNTHDIKVVKSSRVGTG